MLMNFLSSFNIPLRAFLLTALVSSGCAERQQSVTNIALMGVVTSGQEGPMEGVVVILRGVDETVLTSVTSDATGEFQFHRDRLGAGEYDVSVRAAGYELLETKTVVIDDKKTHSLGQLSLAAVTDPLRLASQLTSLDWVNSFPGSQAEKDLLVKNMVKNISIKRLKD